MTEIGCHYGSKSEDDELDYLYYNTSHAHHFGLGDCRFDEVIEGERNAWHVQGYFDRKPYNSLYDYRGGQPRDVFYRMKWPDQQSEQAFLRNESPTEDQLDGSSGTFSASFSVGVPFSPYISGGVGVGLSVPLGNGDYTYEAPYDKFEWSISFDQGYTNPPLPDSQDNSRGVRADVKSFFDPWTYSTIECGSNFSWEMNYGRTQPYYETGMTSHSAVWETVK